MKKLISTLSFVSVILGSLLAPAALADNSFGANELKKSACANTVGAPVINVEQQVKNDADSAVGGNAWAMDHYKREIVVYKTTAANTYCAIVKYEGGFVTLAGASPQNTGTVGAGIKGAMSGGYRSTLFTGTLKSNPSKPTHGSIGTYDYACDTSFNCPGVVNWRTLYFDNISGFDLAWWGWQYKTAKNGSWINAVTGNVGDITGVLTTGKDKDDKNDNHQDGEQADD